MSTELGFLDRLVGKPGLGDMCTLGRGVVRSSSSWLGCVEDGGRFGPAAIHRRGSGSPGFTLIELLTAVTIIAVLVTLLLTAVGAAQRKSKQIRCVGNLHQLSLALGMYLDDFNRRPPSLASFVKGGYLSDSRILVCPQDATRNWAGILGRGQGGMNWLAVGDVGAGVSVEAPEIPPACSYLVPLGLGEEAWSRLLRAGGQAGLAVCQMHGLGSPGLGSMPSLYDFQGVILRAQRDGAVVVRKVFWGIETLQVSTFPPETSGTDRADTGVGNFAAPESVPWRLFVDDLPE